jgi:cysteine desulfurase/selenocysteine lyase
MAREGHPVLVDGAQAAPRHPVDVRLSTATSTPLRAQDVRALGHRGAVRQSAVARVHAPYQGGSDMISSVTFAKSTWNVLPYKFEAGTPTSRRIPRSRRGRLPAGPGPGRDRGTRTTCSRPPPERLGAIPGLKAIGTARQKAAVLSFTMDGAIRTTSARCSTARAWPCARATTARSPLDFFRSRRRRASFGLYNTHAEWRRSPPASAKSKGCSHERRGRPARPVPGGDPGPRQAPEKLGRFRTPTAGPRLQPSAATARQSI